MIVNRDILNNLCINITDGEHASVQNDEAGKYFLLSNKNIINGQIVITNNERKISYETFAKINKRTRLEKGDLVISTVGILGKLAIIKDENLYYDFQRSVGMIKCDESLLNTNYLYHYLNADFVQLRLNYLSKGAVQKCLFISDIKNLEIDFPDISTQQKIAKVLSDLDAKIELNNRINTELEAMAKTLYDYWFVQFDFPDANGKPYKTSGGKMVWNEELKREIPKDWEDGMLDSIGDIIGGSTPSKAIASNFCNNEGTPWITPKDLSNNKGKKFITRGEFDVTERGLKEASLKIMPAGTVLLSSRAPIGYLAIAREKVTTNQGFKSFVPKNIFSSEYIYFTIQNLIPEIEANSSGSTFKEVSLSTLKTIKTILPTNSVLSSFYDMIKPIFKKQDCLELENQELASLRDWLLPMLMNGQVSVGEVKEELGMVAEEREKYGK